jgi:hypothetical protein
MFELAQQFHESEVEAQHIKLSVRFKKKQGIVSVVSVFPGKFTTETVKTRRLHRRIFRLGTLCRQAASQPS